MSFFINSYRFAGGGGLILDQVAGFIHAYSHRKLRDAYSGSAIKARRSSDNGTIDIGFVLNELDESTLTTFTGASDGFKETFYDQVGNRNLNTTFKLNQPKIVNSGTVVKVSGKPYDQYDGINHVMITTSATPITDKDCTVFLVFESQSDIGVGGVFEENATFSDRNVIFSDTRSTIFLHSLYKPQVAVTTNVFPSQQPTSTKRCFVIRKSGTTFEAYDETGLLIDSNINGDTFSLDTIFSLGKQTAGDLFFGGKVAELLINNTALSPTDQTTVLNNIKAHYSIP